MGVHTHGGDVESFRLEYGLTPLDYSANVSPLGLPAGVARAVTASLETADAYPDPHCRQLRSAISAKLGVPAEYILCGNGAADIIFRLAYGLRPKRALVTAPTFAE